MKLDDITAAWAADAIIDGTALDVAASLTPVLHAKYLKLLVDERMLSRKLQSDLRDLESAKRDRLTGHITREELEKRGWEPERRRVTTREVDKILEADQEIINLRLRIGLQDEKVQALTEIVKMVSGRNYVIKSMIDWRKFQSGA